MLITISFLYIGGFTMRGKPIRVFFFLFLTALLLCCFALWAGAAAAEEAVSSEVPAACVTHTPGPWAPDGKGGHTAKCAVCGETLRETCAYGAAITAAPTQTAPGSITRTCSVCGYTLTQTTAPAEKDRPESRVMGDLNFNGKTDGDDARAILRAAVGLEALRRREA